MLYEVITNAMLLAKHTTKLGNSEVNSKKQLKYLMEMGAEDIIVIAGGVIPPGDYEFMFNAGVKGVFGPGTSIIESANKVKEAVP